MMRAMATTGVLWAAWDGRGLEHLRLHVAPGSVRADSFIIAMADDGRPYRARYQIDCDGAWAVRRARVELLEEPARALDLRADGHGRWTDGATGAALSLDGCVDVDVFPSPFTNTLPIRRLPDLAIGRPVALDVAWVVLPELTVQVARQEYTLLARGVDGARWRFRALGSDFAAELSVDRDGLVRDYPEIARRVV
jgi:uncharacterized protein